MPFNATYTLPLSAPSVSGHALTSTSGGQWSWSDSGAIASDARVKNSVIDLDSNDAIKSIQSLNIRKYKFNNNYAREYGKNSERYYSGIIANELEVTHPHLVITEPVKL